MSGVAIQYKFENHPKYSPKIVQKQVSWKGQMYEVLELYVLHLPKKIAPSPIGGKVFFKLGQLEVQNYGSCG